MTPVRGRRRFITKGIVAVSLSIAAVAGVSVAPAFAITNTVPDKDFWQVNGLVRATLETPNAIYLAGQFTALLGPNGQSVARTNFAALDPVTGQPLPFQADTNRQIWAIAASADYSQIFIGGDFQKVDGKNRHRLAAVDATTGALLPFDPNLNARARSVVVNGTTVYVGGDFTTLAGASRSHLAAVDSTTGALIPSFTATASDYVSAMVLSSDLTRLFIGGDFSSVSGASSSSYLAAVNPTTGAVSTLSSRPSDEVLALAVQPGQLAVGIGGGTNAEAVYSTTTMSRQWQVGTDGDIQATVFQNGVLYVGGHFTEYNNRTTGHLVAVSAASGQQLTWLAKPNSALGIFSLTSFDNHLSVGGAFTKINFIARQHYARFDEI